MIDLRPVAHPIGKILIVLGAGMTLPMALDWWDGNPNWTIFLQCSLLTMVAGGMVTVISSTVPRPLGLTTWLLVTT